jgi:hypothetical protein
VIKEYRVRIHKIEPRSSSGPLKISLEHNLSSQMLQIQLDFFAHAWSQLQFGRQLGEINFLRHLANLVIALQSYHFDLFNG